MSETGERFELPKEVVRCYWDEDRECKIPGIREFLKKNRYVPEECLKYCRLCLLGDISKSLYHIWDAMKH